MNVTSNDIEILRMEISKLKKKYKKLKKYKYLSGPMGLMGPMGPSGQNGSMGATGATGATGETGMEGPALFTLTNDVSFEPVFLLTSNSITTNTNSVSIVSTVENYRTAFLTFKLNSGRPIVGFNSISTNLNSFYFNFNVDEGSNNMVTIGYNGVSSIDQYSYEPGQIFTIALTSATCRYYSNGILLKSVDTNENYLNVYAYFETQDPTEITNIAFGYLADPIVTVG